MPQTEFQGLITYDPDGESCEQIKAAIYIMSCSTVHNMLHGFGCIIRVLAIAVQLDHCMWYRPAIVTTKF